MPLVFSSLLALFGVLLGLRAVVQRKRRHTSDNKHRSLSICLNTASIAAFVALVASGLMAHMTPATQPPHTKSPPSEPSHPLDDRTDELNALFADAEEGAFIDLSGQSYWVDGYVILPQRASITVDASDSEFRGRAVFLSVNSRELTWTGGTFTGDGTDATRLSFNVFGADDAAFLEMTFRSAISFGNHAFDLLGAENVTIDRLTVEGYGNHMNIEQLSPHSLYSEAIQIDYAHERGIGNSRTIDLVTKFGGQFDGTPTSGVKLRDSTFIPTYDTDGVISTWAPSPIGEHAAPSSLDRPKEIEIQGNTFVDPIPLLGNPSEDVTGALHFGSIEQLEVSNNLFTSSPGQARSSWIQIGMPVHHDENPDPAQLDLRIVDNTFTGTRPTHSYVEVHGSRCGSLNLAGNQLSRTGGDPVPLCQTR